MHITRKDMERFSSGKLPPQERRRVIRHLLTQCEPCLKLAREVGLPSEDGEEQQYDYSGVLRRLELAYVVAKQEILEERTYASEVWATFLSKLDSGQRLRAIRDNPSFQVWGLFDLFLDEAKRVDPERGLHLSYTALRLLRESHSTDKHMELGGLYLTAYWSNELGHEDEARVTLETYRYLFELFPDPVTQGRLLMLDGLISRREGRLAYSERLFRQLVDLYSEHHIEFDLALASLEWAGSLVLLRRFDDATDVMSQVYPLISSWNIHIDILRSWLIVKEAVRGKAIEDASFRELAMMLRRKWHLKGSGDVGRKG